MSLVPATTATLESEGSAIVKHNKRIAAFASMLAHPEFAAFFDTYFETWDDAQHSIMLLKTGSLLRDSLTDNSQEPASGNQIAAMLHRMITDSKLRRYMVEQFLAFQGSSYHNEDEKRIES